MFGGVPGKVLDIDKRLLLEKGSDFETLSELPKGLSPPSRHPHLAFAPIFPPYLFSPPCLLRSVPFPVPASHTCLSPTHSLLLCPFPPLHRLFFNQPDA